MKCFLRPWARRLALALALGTGLSMLPGCAPVSQQMAKIPGVAQLTRDKKVVSEDDQSKLPYARLCESRGDLAQAEHIYNTLLAKYPENQTVHHRLGIIHARSGRHEESQQHFETALKLGAPNAALLSDLGYSYYLQHRLEDAEKVINEALALEPSYQPAAVNLGLVLGEQGRYDEAIRVFRRGGTEAEALSNMGYIHSQQGELEQAMQCYSQALTHDSTLRPAALALMQLDKHMRMQQGQAAAQQQHQLAQQMQQPTGMPYHAVPAVAMQHAQAAAQPHPAQTAAAADLVVFDAPMMQPSAAGPEVAPPPATQNWPMPQQQPQEQQGFQQQAYQHTQAYHMQPQQPTGPSPVVHASQQASPMMQTPSRLPTSPAMAMVVTPTMAPPTMPAPHMSQPQAMANYGATARPIEHGSGMQPLSAGTLPQHQPPTFGVQSSPFVQTMPQQSQPPIFGPQPQAVNQPHGQIQAQSPQPMAQPLPSVMPQGGARITSVRPYSP